MRTLAMLTTATALTVTLAAPGVAGTATRAVAQAKATAKAESNAAAGTQSPSAAPAQQPASSQAPSAAQTEASTAAQASIDAEAQARAQADAEAKLKARQTLDRIKERGAKTSSQARAKAEAKLAAVATKTGEDAARHGSATVAARLAAEFGMSADEITAEHQALGCSWGELMIAHSLDANTTSEVTVAQLLELRKEGTGWGQIAAGLGLKLGEVVSAVQAEGRVAAGLAKPDGKVATIRGDGARAGVGAGAAASAGTRAGGTSATAQTGVGVGVKIKP